MAARKHRPVNPHYMQEDGNQLINHNAYDQITSLLHSGVPYTCHSPNLYSITMEAESKRALNQSRMEVTQFGSMAAKHPLSNY